VNYHYDQINERNYYGPNGHLPSGGQETGSDFADFLLGAPNGLSGQQADSRLTQSLLPEPMHKILRVLSNLVLNYGVRYEVTTLGTTLRTSLKQLFPSAIYRFSWRSQGIIRASDLEYSRTPGTLIRWNNFAPRFGFAFSPKATDGFLAKVTGVPT